MPLCADEITLNATGLFSGAVMTKGRPDVVTPVDVLPSTRVMGPSPVPMPVVTIRFALLPAPLVTATGDVLLPEPETPNDQSDVATANELLLLVVTSSLTSG